MPDEWSKVPKLFGQVHQIQIERLGGTAVLVVGIRSEESSELTHFRLDLSGHDPVTFAQVDLLRDALRSKSTVRIAYHPATESEAHELVAVRLHAV